MSTLERALEVVKAGWCKGSFRNNNDECCILGAIYKVNGTYKHPDTFSLIQHLPDFGYSKSDIIEFNDDPGTTKDMVIALFEKAIADQDD